MTASRALVAVTMGIGLWASLGVAVAGPFNLEKPLGPQIATGGFAAPPTALPPFIHWDLREFPGCTVPYSYFNGTPDIAGTLEFDEIDAGFGAWRDVVPAIIGFSRVLPAAGAMCPLQRDSHNMLGWNNFACGAPGDDVWLAGAGGAPACGNAVGANVAIIGPGPDGWLITLPNNCPQDDVWIGGALACGAAAPGGAGAAIIGPGANGVFNTTPNNCNVMGDDTIAGGNITAGPDGIVDTLIMGLVGDDTYAGGNITSGPNGIIETTPNGALPASVFAVTAIFHNTTSGVIIESDILFNDAWTWNTHANGAAMGLQPDVRTVATHETGHFLGLHHTGPFGFASPPGPIMNPFLFTTDDAWAGGAALACGAAIAGGAAIIGPGGNGVFETVVNNCAFPPFIVGDDVIAGGNITDGGNATVDSIILPNTANHVLAADDIAGLNFLYTPDLGDAPDPCLAIFNEYQSLVRSAAPGRVLNGVQLFVPGQGPVHLYGHPPDEFEWLGAAMDGHALECESRQVDADLFDDGVAFPAPLIRGAFNRITVTVTHSGPAGRYVGNDDVCLWPPLLGGCACGAVTIPGATQLPYIGPGPDFVLQTPVNNCVGGGLALNDVVAAGPGGGNVGAVITTGADNVMDSFIPVVVAPSSSKRLYVNGYMDFDNDCVFDPGDLALWWEGVPDAPAGAGALAGIPASVCSDIAASGNFVGHLCTPNSIILDFDVFVPAGAEANFYSRFRLDYGEDEGREQDINGDNDPAEGVAQFGEVEDYFHRAQDKDHCGPGPHWVDTCAAGTDTLASTEALVAIDINGDCLGDAIAILSGPVTVDRSDPLNASANFPAVTGPAGHVGPDVLDTEIVSMNLTGGGVTLVAGQGLGAGPALPPTGLTASRGAIVEKVADPSRAESFFDVFFELDLGGGNYAYNQTPVRVRAELNKVPPKERRYIHLLGCVPLFNSPIPGAGARIANLASACHGIGPPGICGQPPFLGACCDRRTGECIDGAPVEQCIGPTLIWTDGANCLELVPRCGCLTPEDCDDGNACTADSCGADGTCSSTSAVPAGQCCDPLTGELAPIDDGNPCTIDACDPATGVVDHTPINQCVDGDGCCPSPQACAGIDSDCPVGCCLPDDTCEGLVLSDCLVLQGTPLGAGQACGAPQACCFLADGTCRDVDPACCGRLGGESQPGLCLGDADGNGVDDTCQKLIPTVSEWGLLAMTLLLLAGGKVYFGRRWVT